MTWQREMAWRRLDERGEDRCVYACVEGACVIEGLGAVAINGAGLVFEYRMGFQSDWTFKQAGIVAKLGEDEHRLMVERRDDGEWLVDGVHDPLFSGCSDIDLAFTAATNTLAIKRLNLQVGEEADSKSFWVAEPTLRAEVLEHHYKRTGRNEYEYSSGLFKTTLEVDDDGIIQRYEGLWVPFEMPATVGAGF